jgi:glutathione S-transferase
MIRLCGFRISNYHNKVRIALLEKGVAFEEDENVKPSQEGEYLAKSPMGKVPYLEVDGTRIRESSAILEYLEDAYPQKPLLPSDPVARACARAGDLHRAAPGAGSAAHVRHARRRQAGVG